MHSLETLKKLNDRAMVKRNEKLLKELIIRGNAFAEERKKIGWEVEEDEKYKATVEV